MREQTFQRLLKPHSFPLSWRDKKGAPGGIQFKVPPGLSINQTQPDVPQSLPCGFLQNCPGHWREVIDKAPEMGYSKDTKGAASRTAPVCYREVTVTFGRVRRLLLFAILENQSNDSQNDHAELKQFTP